MHNRYGKMQIPYPTDKWHNNVSLKGFPIISRIVVVKKLGKVIIERKWITFCAFVISLDVYMKIRILIFKL
jgi:hypothetical protein